MRFPWLQVDADFIGAHAGDLGAHLGISRREAMGLALDLWTWALARAPDDAPPDGLVTGTGAVPDRLLAGSVGWTGPVEEFSGALLAVGLAVRVEGGYRLTGFDRYKSTWEKNRRRTGGKPERNRSGTGEEPARKTQTQTQTQKEDHASHGEADAPSDAYRADEQPPTDPLPDATECAEEVPEREVLQLRPLPGGPKQRQPSKAEALYTALQDSRRLQCEEAGVAFVDEHWAPARQNKALGALARLVKGSPEANALNAAWAEYLADESMAAKDVPWSIGYFLASRAQWEGRALKAAGGGA